MNLTLNPGLDRPSLAAAFARDGRVQLREVLAGNGALEVEQALRELPWSLVFRENGQVSGLSPERLARLDAETAQAVRRVVDEGARDGFQFLYNCFPMLEEYFAPQRTERAAFAAFEFLNSPPVLDLLRSVTGLEETRWLDGQGALYRAGHFLKRHNDFSGEEPRLAAYVFSFARDWEIEWGGMLEFWNEEKDVEFALRPRFNALNLFRVPCWHSVSQVASWSPGLRFSITGWLRADDPPAPFPHSPG